jgi:hypothetical protein
MWYQFVLENVHFALNILGALVLFAVCWLYGDAWSARKQDTRIGFRALGFLLLSVSYVFHAMEVEGIVTSTIPFSSWIAGVGVPVLRLIGYACVIWSLATEALMPVPKYNEEGKVSAVAGSGVAGSGGLLQFLYLFGSPLGALATGLFYIRRSTVGLERHVRTVGVAFLLLALSDVFGISALLRNSTNVDVFNAVKPFGAAWMITHIFLAAGFVLLERWVFGYLLKRFETQLFIIYTTTVVVIYLIITVVFTGLLVGNVASITQAQLETDARVLSYAIDSRKNEALSLARILATDSQVVTALGKRDRQTIADITGRQLESSVQSYIIVVNANGQVVARGDDAEKYGDSLSGDPLVVKALARTDSTGVVVHDGVIAPELSVRAATPIVSDNAVIGAAIVGTVLETTFVDGLKRSTGLEATLYGSDMKVSASTLTTADGVTRPLGIILTNQKVRKAVIDESKSYTGAITFLSRAMYASFLPIQDINKVTIGMVSIAKSQLAVLALAGQSIQMTFIVAAILILLSVVPAYFIARFMARQL